jgi:hypothetical protein
MALGLLLVANLSDPHARAVGFPAAWTVERRFDRKSGEDEGISSWIEEAHVMRHAAGVPQHSAGHHGRALAFLRSADGRSGISFAGDYFSGGYLEPALWSAERGARGGAHWVTATQGRHAVERVPLPCGTLPRFRDGRPAASGV